LWEESIVQLPNYKRGDIVLSLPPFRKVVYVILEIDPEKPKNWYDALRPDNGRRYCLGDDALLKIGEATAEFLDKEGHIEVSGPVADEAYERGQARAQREALLHTGEDKKRWELLAAAQPGNRIPVHLQHGTEELKFHHVVERGEKYVFVAEDRRGKVYRFPLTAPCLGGKAAESD
jgi:hypothetical protein